MGYQMLKVLFVDEEIQVLESFRRSLHIRNRDCHLNFCTNAKAALRILDSESYDVVFCDTCLPLVSGVDFLQELKERHPLTIRVALSGLVDQEQILRVLGETHIFLQKPTSDDVISGLVDQITEIMIRVKSTELRASLLKLPNLPVLPEIYSQLTETIRKDEASLEEIGMLINKDTALTVKLLQVANSAYFTSHKRTLNVSEIVTFMGLAHLTHLILAIKVFDQLSSPGIQEVAKIIWNRSQIISQIVKKIAKSENLKEQEIGVLSVCAILHDIGELYLLSQKQIDASNYTWTLQGDSSIKEIEESLGVGHHTDLCIYLLVIWGFPIEVIQCISEQQNLPSSDQTSLSKYLMAAKSIYEAKSRQGKSILTFARSGKLDPKKLRAWYKL